MLIKPAFFDEFTCKASACRQTCCAGWEIYVDDDTAARYETLLDSGEKRLLERTADGILLCREGGRCKFLRGDGLCELIISHGEEILCDICREHPRFYSYSENGSVCEAGVGLCCEEAVGLWLSADPEFIREDDGYEPDSDELLTLDRQTRLISELLSGKAAIPELDYKRLRGIYGRMETLEPLDFPEDFSADLRADERTRRLMAYYVYRWYFEYPDFALTFAAANALMTLSLGGDFSDAARRISAEVEYDPDNTSLVIEGISCLI